MWRPSLDVTYDQNDPGDDRHVEIIIEASGVLPPDDYDDGEWERSRPTIATMRRFVAGELARLALVLAEPVSVVAAAHGCHAPVSEHSSTAARTLTDETIKRYRNELMRSDRGQWLHGHYDAEVKSIYWPDSCGVWSNLLVTPNADHGDCPALWLSVPNWHGGREAKWWIDQARHALAQIRADS